LEALDQCKTKFSQKENECHSRNGEEKAANETIFNQGVSDALVNYYLRADACGCTNQGYPDDYTYGPQLFPHWFSEAENTSRVKKRLEEYRRQAQENAERGPTATQDTSPDLPGYGQKPLDWRLNQHYRPTFNDPLYFSPWLQTNKPWPNIPFPCFFSLGCD
jgi:hypothetical protein